MGTAAPKEGGKHEAEDFPEELLLGSQAAFDLDDEVIRQAHVAEGLVQGFDIALGLALLVLMAFFRMQTSAVDGLRVLFDVSLGAGQPFPFIISEPYDTHGSGACTQRFAYPVLSLEATLAISHTRVSCEKRTAGEIEAHFSHTAGKPTHSAMACGHRGHGWRLGGIQAKDGGGLRQTV
jgi:hypothetical protein